MSSYHKIFITGTDTDVGKTYVTRGLLQQFKENGYQTLGLKPIASGCNAQGENDDALQLKQVSTKILSYTDINPFALQRPIAPHIAARLMNTSISVSSLHQAVMPGLSTPVDICLIEGAGGWLVPLNEKETYADWVVSSNLDIVLVVKMALGCLNHALLTAESILRRDGKLIGWIANCPVDRMDNMDENIQTLVQRLPAPHLGTVFFGESLKPVFLKLMPLLKKKHK